MRFVNFQFVTYDLRNGNILHIAPILMQEKDGFNIEMENEKYLVETKGNFGIQNLRQNTLHNFATFLSDYLEALHSLT
jgi:hypothetical protein